MESILNWLVKQPGGFTTLVIIFSIILFALFNKYYFMKNHKALTQEAINQSRIKDLEEIKKLNEDKNSLKEVINHKEMRISMLEDEIRNHKDKINSLNNEIRHKEVLQQLKIYNHKEVLSNG